MIDLKTFKLKNCAFCDYNGGHRSKIKDPSKIFCAYRGKLEIVNSICLIKTNQAIPNMIRG